MARVFGSNKLRIFAPGIIDSWTLELASCALVSDFPHDPAIFYGLTRGHFLKRDREIAIGDSGFLEHLPESLNEPGLLFWRMDCAYHADNRGNG